MSVAELLRSAAAKGEEVMLVYNAGSRPGQARTVLPLSVSEDALIAVETSSRVNKTYKLDRIARVELANGIRATNERVKERAAGLTFPDLPNLRKLADYVDLFRPELIGAGWHLYEGSESFGIATRFKNGKPKKTPSILISYFDRTTETVFDPDRGEVICVPRELTGRERPWRVDSWRFREGKTFPELQRAFAAFLEEARASDSASSKSAWAGR